MTTDNTEGITDEFFWYLVNNQRKWKDEYRKQKQETRDDYNAKMRVYQEKRRRERGIPIRIRKNALSNF